MRQGQQNRRGRGRGGRKGQSPLSRSFESSGPDVKIRGTAQHIAEKYMALARDAIGSGDLVLGESYLQHAEHYNRIIMAAQTQTPGSFDQMNGNGQRIARPEGEFHQVDGGSDGFEGDDDGDGDQPGSGGGVDQPRQFEPSGQRDHQYQQPQRHRDNRNYEPRNFDNRNNDPRPLEPRYQDPPRPPGNNGEQPRGFEQPRPQQDNRDSRPGFEGRQGDAAGPRGRRRRGRNDGGSSRPYPPQVANAGEPGEPGEPQRAAEPLHEGHQDSNGGDGGDQD